MPPEQKGALGAAATVDCAGSCPRRARAWRAPRTQAYQPKLPPMVSYGPSGTGTGTGTFTARPAIQGHALVALALFDALEIRHDPGDALAHHVFDEVPERVFVLALTEQAERDAKAAHVGAPATIGPTLAVVTEGVLHESRRIDR